MRYLENRETTLENRLFIDCINNGTIDIFLGKEFAKKTKNRAGKWTYEDYYGEIYLIYHRDFPKIDLDKLKVEQYFKFIVKEAVRNIRFKDQKIHLSENKLKLAHKMEQVAKAYYREFEEQPVDEELADRCGIKVEDVKVLRSVRNVGSLDDQVGDDATECVADYIDGEDRTLDDWMEDRDKKAVMKRCFLYLKDKGIVTDEDIRCFVAWYIPEKGKEAEKQDDLCEPLHYNSHQALGQHIRKVRNALSMITECRKALGGYL